jgi:urease accessory protein
MSPCFRAILVAAPAILLASPASAHLDPVAHGSFAAGFTHPLSGIDHVLAMVTVGVWAGLIGGRAAWLVPAAFVVTMIAGFVAAIGGIELPLVEPVVLASIIVIGLLAAIALPVPAAAAAALVALFAFFHGHAHGGELGVAGAAPFGAGFAVATALLHGAGLVICFALARALGSHGRLATRAVAGVAVACGFALALA